MRAGTVDEKIDTVCTLYRWTINQKSPINMFCP